jgi:hypothetical protein
MMGSPWELSAKEKTHDYIYYDKRKESTIMKTKRFVVSALMLALCVSAFGQGTEPMYSSLSATSGIIESNMDMNYYGPAAKGRRKIVDKTSTHWKTYLALRAVGWSAFGVGIGASFVGLVGFAGEYAAHGPNHNIWYAPFFFGGPALFVASIPTLICAYYQRHKAIIYSVGYRSIPVAQPTGNAYNMPALSLSIHF